MPGQQEAGGAEVENSVAKGRDIILAWSLPHAHAESTPMLTRVGTKKRKQKPFCGQTTPVAIF